MIALALSLAVAAASSPASERVAWYDCLEVYSQVAMLGTKSTPTVALDALATCSNERKAFQIKLFRYFRAIGAKDPPSLSTLVADEDRSAALRVIAFLNRHRRHM